MADVPEPPRGELVLYQTKDGRTRVECRFEQETIWLTQALIAELFQKDVRTISEHLQNIFQEGKLAPEATIRKFRIVRREGQRNVARAIEQYNLDVILAVGYRVRSLRGTLFRRWATERLSEYLVKGLAMDDERLKNPPIFGMNAVYKRKRVNRRKSLARASGLYEFAANISQGYDQGPHLQLKRDSNRFGSRA